MVHSIRKSYGSSITEKQKKELKQMSKHEYQLREETEELSQLLEGVEITRKELKGHFGKHGIKEIDPMGEKLDPNLHQAVVQLDAPEAPQGTIIQVMQPGYVIHDRLLRAAMVGVAKGAPSSNGEAPVAEVEKAQEEDAQT